MGVYCFRCKLFPSAPTHSFKQTNSYLTKPKSQKCCRWIDMVGYERMLELALFPYFPIPRRESEWEGEREKRVEYELIAMKIFSMICIKMLININISMNINIFHDRFIYILYICKCLLSVWRSIQKCSREDGGMVLISRLGAHFPHIYRFSNRPRGKR